MVKSLRPQQAADALGVSISTFWKLAKSDASFPEVIKLSYRCSIVRENDLVNYIDSKARNTQSNRSERA